MTTQMNNTQTKFFKQSKYSTRDDKISTSYDNKNKNSIHTKTTSNWPKIKDYSGDQNVEFGKTKINMRNSFIGDPVYIFIITEYLY